MKEIIKYLKEQLEQIKKYDGTMNSASWGYEEGILITGDDAEKILKHLEESSNIKQSNGITIFSDEDMYLARKIVDDIVDNTDVSQIRDKITKMIEPYEGNRRRRMLIFLNGCFGNILWNELHMKCDEAEERALEARMVMKQLNNRK